MRLTSRLKYAVASLIVVLLTLCIDQFVFKTNVNKASKTLEVDIAAVRQSTVATNQQQTSHSDLPKAMDSQTGPMASLAFVTLSLPAPPNITEQFASSDLPEKTERIENLDESDLAVSPARLSEVYSKAAIESSVSKQVIQQKKPIESINPLQTNANPTPYKSPATETQYKQLSQLGTANLRLRFPNDWRTTEQILRFMHECIGISLGAYDVSKEDANKLTLLTENQQDYSQIMRVVSGQQTKRETNLLKVYAPGQQLVRLYPSWFDYAMSAKIADVIGMQALTQLSGTYQLRGNELLLLNVSINDQMVAGNWSLAKLNVCGSSPQLALQ
jgi:hypothetical protein